ncbi:protein-methionine-sulfoxide reductase catalytic subunit MsrP [Helicobacter sp. faydin-H20]|uniref:protein-methionine-sulfoxide reductase catalytic subunit MsrP n=1 Tax=Helicobacter anatolicus TaxID=2905874 RepID=UPI001E4DA969|nr:protein-methionine-sulfoxide reductase catalytic subunit MsrP [Helicobacter anatolicus]MCE3037639.1 protein-methionine-sulfoxide reductase catalytic subunit MsrP [Helicobacter anatolicus]
MRIIYKKSWEIKENTITDEGVYQKRREILKTMPLGFLSLGMGMQGIFAEENITELVFNDKKYSFIKNINYLQEELTPFEKASTYNNFYEFGMQKDDPYYRAKILKTSPWDLVIDGEVEKPLKISLEKILQSMPLEERVYRFRCVEAWSMIIPWIGFEFNKLLRLAKPTSQAKYVIFETLKQDDMPAVKNPFLAANIPFPYVEGLRIDEAMHPLCILAVGMYGRKLPNQNGAPLRLVVPWKYGFKNIKSIVRITLSKTQPLSTWQRLAGDEYGFYANVNPDVAHPRWSQASERFIGEGYRPTRIKTQIFNGYGDEVARLYANMDLEKNF